MADRSSSSLGCLILAVALFFLPGMLIGGLIWPQQTDNQMVGRGFLIGLGLLLLAIFLGGRWLFRRP